MVLVSLDLKMDIAGSSHERIARAGRLYSIDTAKGVGIIFVVFAHAWRGAYDAGLLHDSALFNAVDRAIYAWHMPLFFFLSGLLFLDAISRIPPLTFVWGRVRRMLWPMVLWTWIFFALRLLAGQAANYPVTWVDFPLLPLPPYEHLWFLWALLIVQLVALPLCLLLKPRLGPQFLALAFATTAIALALSIPFVALPSLYFGAAVEHSPYFLLGIAAARLAHLRPPTWLVGLAAIGLVSLIYQAVDIRFALIQSLALIAAIWIVFARIDTNEENSGPTLSMLRHLGQASLAIFLTHTIFSAAWRIGLVSLGTQDLAVHLVGATVIGLAAPLGLLWVMRWAGVMRWSGL